MEREDDYRNDGDRVNGDGRDESWDDNRSAEDNQNRMKARKKARKELWKFNTRRDSGRNMKGAVI